MTIKHSTRIIFLFSLFFLAACTRTQPFPNGPLNYETDPRILRGVWTGQSEAGATLTLDLRTKSPSANGYTSVGTFKLGDTPEVLFSAYTQIALAESSFLMTQQDGEPECIGNVTGQVDNTFGVETELFFDVCGTTPTGSPPKFHMTLIDRNGSTSVESDFVVKGSIVHLRGIPGTYDGEFEFTEDSHAIVQL